MTTDDAVVIWHCSGFTRFIYLHTCNFWETFLIVSCKSPRQSVSSKICFLFFFLGTTAQRHDRLILEVSRSHAMTLQSVGLIWTRDRPVAETSTSQHTQHSQETDIHAPGGIRMRNSIKRAATDPLFRPLSHWFRHSFLLVSLHWPYSPWRTLAFFRINFRASLSLAIFCLLLVNYISKNLLIA